MNGATSIAEFSSWKMMMDIYTAQPCIPQGSLNREHSI